MSERHSLYFTSLFYDDDTNSPVGDTASKTSIVYSYTTPDDLSQLVTATQHQHKRKSQKPNLAPLHSDVQFIDPVLFPFLTSLQGNLVRLFEYHPCEAMVPFGKSSAMRKRSHSTSGDYTNSAITIKESDIGISGKRKVRRCVSVPYGIRDIKSIMRCRTLDESLHSAYGSTASKGDRGIKFDKIVIREYSRTLGDNPSCSSGPPVSISWEYNIMGEVSLEEYEYTRPRRRSQMEMVLPRKVRFDMLRKEWDVTQRQIAEAVRRNVKTKNQRRTTVNNLGKAPKIEQVMESLGRKVKRTLLFQKPVSRQVRNLEAKHNEALRLRKQYALELEMKDEYESPRSSMDGNIASGEKTIETHIET